MTKPTIEECIEQLDWIPDHVVADAIRDHLKATQWQPIETAPMDGVTKALYGCWHEGKWYEQITKRGSGVGGLHVNVPTGFRKYTAATHWMPLPQPPVAREAQGE